MGSGWVRDGGGRALVVSHPAGGAGARGCRRRRVVASLPTACAHRGAELGAGLWPPSSGEQLRAWGGRADRDARRRPRPEWGGRGAFRRVLECEPSPAQDLHDPYAGHVEGGLPHLARRPSSGVGGLSFRPGRGRPAAFLGAERIRLAAQVVQVSGRSGGASHVLPCDGGKWIAWRRPKLPGDGACSPVYPGGCGGAPLRARGDDPSAWRSLVPQAPARGCTRLPTFRTRAFTPPYRAGRAGPGGRGRLHPATAVGRGEDADDRSARWRMDGSSHGARAGVGAHGSHRRGRSRGCSTGGLGFAGRRGGRTGRRRCGRGGTHSALYHSVVGSVGVPAAGDRVVVGGSGVVVDAPWWAFERRTAARGGRIGRRPGAGRRGARYGSLLRAASTRQRCGGDTGLSRVSPFLALRCAALSPRWRGDRDLRGVRGSATRGGSAGKSGMPSLWWALRRGGTFLREGRDPTALSPSSTLPPWYCGWFQSVARRRWRSSHRKGGEAGPGARVAEPGSRGGGNDARREPPPRSLPSDDGMGRGGEAARRGDAAAQEARSFLSSSVNSGTAWNRSAVRK